jgi:hypothetical protein
MRISSAFLVLALATLGWSVCPAADPQPYISGLTGPPIPGYPPNAIFMSGPPKIYKFVSLNSERALEELKANNPGRYAIAQRIIQAGAEICSPGAPKTASARFEAEDLSCSANIWYTSNPPKRQLTFRIGDTIYATRVTVPVQPD